MIRSILYSALATVTAILIAACASGNDVAGIGGSGVTSTGPITGFGSIFVNGVEFETSSSTFDVDDNPDSTEDNLAIGMRVTVNGTLNADGVTGIATSVTYDDQLQGPVSNDPVMTGTDSKTFTVLGIEVVVNSTTTRFDTDDSVAGSLNFNNIRAGNIVEISGSYDSSGNLIATRVELKEQDFTDDSSIIEIRGTISGLVGTSFTLNLQGMSGASVDVETSGVSEYDDLPPGGLADGAFVEVKGTCPTIDCPIVNATRIQGESEGFDHDGEAEIEGFITRYVSDSDFDVDGLPVNASNAVKEPASLVLTEDLRVEVKGTIVDNVLVATRVELED